MMGDGVLLNALDTAISRAEAAERERDALQQAVIAYCTTRYSATYDTLGKVLLEQGVKLPYWDALAHPAPSSEEGDETRGYRESLKRYDAAGLVKGQESQRIAGYRNVAFGAVNTLDAALARAEAAERERDALWWAIDTMDFDGERQGITAPEDPHVRLLCERYGYGAVMDSAARQWREKDPIGAFMVGPCVGTMASALAALTHPASPSESEGGETCQ